MAGFGKSDQNSNNATLCANSCGFYGNPNNQNLCSVCYATFLKKKNCSNDIVSEELVEIRDEEPNLGTRRSPSASESSGTSESVADSSSPAPKSKNSREIYTKKICSNDVVSSRNLVEIRDEEPNLGTRRSVAASVSSGTSESVADLKTPAPKSKNRCEICKKKVGLLGFNCRCGGSFCGKHRYPQEHLCGVDYKAIGRQILANQIVECKADKLDFRV